MRRRDCTTSSVDGAAHHRTTHEPVARLLALSERLLHVRRDRATGGSISKGWSSPLRLADVEALNQAAFAGEADVTKLSYHAYAYCTADYVLLDAGSALGRNCGPLLISKRAISQDEVAAGRLRIAIPGRYTTANFLLGLAFPQARDKTELVFSEIEARAAGRASSTPG